MQPGQAAVRLPQCLERVSQERGGLGIGKARAIVALRLAGGSGWLLHLLRALRRRQRQAHVLSAGAARQRQPAQQGRQDDAPHPDPWQSRH